MTTSEKIKILQGVHNADTLLLAQQALSPATVGFNLLENRAYITTDLRTKIRKKMACEGVSQRQISRYLGLSVSAVSDYINGRRGLPYNKLEQLLGLFDLV